MEHDYESNEKKYDFLFIGATGLAGSALLTDFIHQLSSINTPPISICIISRSQRKLDKLSKSSPLQSTSNNITIDKLHKDIAKDQSIISQAKVVVNCILDPWPLNEKLILSCIEQECDYLDWSQEPQFIEYIYSKYGKSARKRNVSIITGMSLLACDLGVLECKEEFASAGVLPCQVEMFYTIFPSQTLAPRGCVSYPAYAAAVRGYSKLESLRKLRKELKIRVPRLGKQLDRHLTPGYDARVMKYTAPYFFPDPSIVRLSQFLMPNSPPVQFAAYSIFPNLLSLLLLLLGQLLFVILAVRSWGKLLLMWYPAIFTAFIVKRTPDHYSPKHDGSDIRYEQRFVARGYSEAIVKQHDHDAALLKMAEPDVSLTVLVEGGHPFWSSNIVGMVMGAIVLWERKYELGCDFRSGVLTPAAAFDQTDLAKRLHNDGRLTFKLVAYQEDSEIQ